MITVDAVLRDRYGLHPRAAMRIQQAAATFAARVTLQELHARAPVDARSMISLVSAGIRSGDTVRIAADGADEADAAEAIKKLLEAGVCHP